MLQYSSILILLYISIILGDIYNTKQMSVNCLCWVDQTNNPSWIKVRRFRLTNYINSSRGDEIDVYLPNTIGMCQVVFDNGPDTVDMSVANAIPYNGMDTEKDNGESRALRSSGWAVWDTNTKSFSRQVDFDKYYIIKFPKDYWDFIS